MDMINNFELFNARVYSERFCCDPSATTSVDNVCREDFMGKRMLVHKKNIESTKNLRARLQKADDATKNIIHDNYEYCSKCQTIHNKSFLSLFGTVQNDSNDSSSTLGSFLCFECDDSKQKTQTEGLTKGRTYSIGKKKLKRKKNKRKKNQVQIITATSNPCSNFEEKKDRDPKSPTSIMSLHVLNHLVDDSIKLPKVLEECIVGVNVPSDSRDHVPHTLEELDSTEVSHHDFVDYLLQSGSILALDKYMDELGLDCPEDEFGDRREVAFI